MDTKNPNPAYGAHLEPFHGIPTFMRRPASRELEGIDAVIVGVPFDSGTSYRSGTRLSDSIAAEAREAPATPEEVPEPAPSAAEQHRAYEARRTGGGGR